MQRKEAVQSVGRKRQVSATGCMTGRPAASFLAFRRLDLDTFCVYVPSRLSAAASECSGPITGAPLVGKGAWRRATLLCVYILGAASLRAAQRSSNGSSADRRGGGLMMIAMTKGFPFESGVQAYAISPV